MIDRKQMKSVLAERLQEQNRLKDAGALTFENYFTIPEGIKQWSPKITPEGTDYGFDIIPFIAGDKYPTGLGYTVMKGTMTYLLDIWVHKNVGPTNKRVVCPAKNYGKACPICDHRQTLLANANTKEERKAIFGEFNPQRRVLYNVIVRSDEKEEAKGIQVFEFSHFYMEKELQARAKKPRGGGLIPYPSPDDDGKTIWFNAILVGDGNWKISGHQFEDRTYIIEDEQIEKATQLDQIVTLLSYDEIKAIFEGEAAESEEEKQPSVGEDVPMYENVDKPLTSNSEKTEDPTCPWGGEFGKEYDDFEECGSCDLADDCNAAKQAMAKPIPKRRLRKS